MSDTRTYGRMKSGPKTKTIEERFWPKVCKETEERVEGMGPCWIWTAHRDPNGYGRFGTGTWRNTKVVLAHRQSYLLIVGELSDDLTLDHLCRIRSCVNPSHLEEVPLAINISRAHDFNRINDVCHRGHPWDEFNTRHRSDGSRYCRGCNREWARDRRARLDQEEAAA